MLGLIAFFSIFVNLNEVLGVLQFSCKLLVFRSRHLFSIGESVCVCNFRYLSVPALWSSCYTGSMFSHLQALLMSEIKGWAVSASQTAPMKLNEWQMLKGAHTLFLENKGSDGNHTLDETIIPPLNLLPQLTLWGRDGNLRPTVQLSHHLHFSPVLASPHFCPLFHLAITVISASVICSDMGVHMLVCACVC